MAATLNIDTKQEILEGAFRYFVECGVENANIRDLVKYIKISEGTVYYWYKNKNELICAAAEYGLKRFADNVFESLFVSLKDIDRYMDNCIKSIDYAKDELRFIYQMAASPVYGDIIRKSTNRFVYTFNEYAQRIAGLSDEVIDELRPIIYLFASCIVDYAIWQNVKETQLQLDYIRQLLKNVLHEKGNTNINQTNS